MDKPGVQFTKPYSKGQITIPLEFRKFLGIEEDTWLLMMAEKEKIVIIPIDKKRIEKLKED